MNVSLKMNMPTTTKKLHIRKMNIYIKKSKVLVLEKIITEMALHLINLKTEISEIKKEKSLIENTEKRCY